MVLGGSGLAEEKEAPEKPKPVGEQPAQPPNSERPGSRDATEALIEMTQAPEDLKIAVASADEDRRYQAVKLLADFGPMARNAVPELASALEDSSLRVRLEAARGLGNVGSYAESAVPELVKRLKDKNTEFRKKIVWALGNIGAKAKAAMPALADVLINDNDAEIRAEAAVAIGTIGIDAESATSALVCALKDRNPPVREKAAWALGEIQPVPAQALDALKEAVQDTNANVRDGAQSSLRSIQRHISLQGEAKLIQALVDRLRSDTDAVQYAARSKLAKIGDPAIPFLLEHLNSGEFDRYYHASSTLWQIRSPKVRTALLKATTDSNPHMRANAIDLLGKIRPATEEAVSAIIAALDDPVANVRRFALGGVNRLGGWSGPCRARAVEPLMRRLEDKESIRYSATFRLGELGRVAKDAVPVLKTMKDDPSLDVSTYAVAAIGKIGDSSDVPFLVDILRNHSNASMRKYGASGLGHLGDAAAAAAPELMRAMRDSDIYIRRVAVSGMCQ